MIYMYDIPSLLEVALNAVEEAVKVENIVEISRVLNKRKANDTETLMCILCTKAEAVTRADLSNSKH